MNFFISIKNYRDNDKLKISQIQQIEKYQSAIEKSKLVMNVTLHTFMHFNNLKLKHIYKIL